MIYLSKKNIELIINVLEKEKKEIQEKLEIQEILYSQKILNDRLQHTEMLINKLGCQMAWGYDK